MRRYKTTGQQCSAVALEKAEDPSPGPGELLIDLRAASLNYRDLLVAARFADVVPLSDGAGVVSGVGGGVAGTSLGDRVVIGFMPQWTDGAFTEAKKASSLGAPGVDGVLTERIVVPASAAVPIPEGMSFEEAATFPCAGVTAWSALFERRPVQPGESVLLLGTGGVSIFSLQLAKLAGARVIVTSRSKDKLARAIALGADHVINYADQPNWEEEVLHLTGGVGVDLAVDVAGPATLSKTLRATRFGGRVSLMGVLTGFEGTVDTAAILERRITLQGIYVGPVASLRAVLKAGVSPAIDQIFPFAEANAAYQALKAARHVGKVVIKISG